MTDETTKRKSYFTYNLTKATSTHIGFRETPTGDEFVKFALERNRQFGLTDVTLGEAFNGKSRIRVRLIKNLVGAYLTGPEIDSLEKARKVHSMVLREFERDRRRINSTMKY